MNLTEPWNIVFAIGLFLYMATRHHFDKKDDEWIFLAKSTKSICWRRERSFHGCGNKYSNKFAMARNQ